MWTDFFKWLESFIIPYLPSYLEPFAIGIVGAILGMAGSIITQFVSFMSTRRRERERVDETFRKLNAKKINEHIKLLGSFGNTVGAAVIGAAFILPYIKEHSELAPDAPRWVLIGLLPPFAGHVALRFLKNES